MNDRCDLIYEMFAENIRSRIDNEILNSIREELEIKHATRFLNNILKTDSINLGVNDKNVIKRFRFIKNFK